MSTIPPANTPEPAEPTEPTADKPPAEKTELDWKAEARKHEDRSKEWKSKADANEDAARRLAELENANKTDLEKAAARAEAAEIKAAELEQRALKAEVAAAKQVPAELLSGATREDLEAAADRLIEFRGAKTPVGVHLPNQDKTPQNQPSALGDTARKLFGG